MSESIKILSIGNSFSEDTMEYVAVIAKNLGVEKIKLGNLYFGGCSITQHYRHATENLPVYIYHQNDGFGWQSTNGVSIDTALKEDTWDYVTIQPGTGDGSRHTSENAYDKLVPLLNFVKERILPTTKIAFNLTWVGEPNSTHHEIVSFNGDQSLLFSSIVDMVKKVVCPLESIDFIIPTGTAVQNARTAIKEVITRDNFHLSFDKGRFLAGLTFFAKITGIDISSVSCKINGVTEDFCKIAINAVNNALKNPFVVTKGK
jgi:hypothetical protein